MEPLLTRLEGEAAKLAAEEIPRFFGRMRALDNVALGMRVQGYNVTHAATLLANAGIDPESVRQVHEAARLLGTKPMFEHQVHAAARSLTDAIQDVRTRNADLLRAADARFDAEIGPAREILEGIDGPPTAEQRAALASVLAYDPAFSSAGIARLNDRLIESVPMSSRVALLRDMIGKPAHELQPDELRLLRRLIEGRQWGTTGGLLDFNADIPYAGRIEDAIMGMAEGTSPRRVLELDRYFVRDAVTRMAEHERLALSVQLFSKDVSEVTPHEWNLLEALTNTDVIGFKSDIIHSLPGHEAFSRHVAFRTMQGLPPSETMYAYFDANALKGLSNAERAKVVQARFELALDEAANGTISKSSQTLLTAAWPAAADHMSQMPIERQSKIALALLGLPSGPSGDREAVRTALHAIDGDLASMDVPQQFTDLYRKTKQLIDRNIGRMEGRHEPGAVRGYSTHPDYAEVGQVRANAVLLTAVRDLAEREAAAAATAPAAPAQPGALTW